MRTAQKGLGKTNTPRHRCTGRELHRTESGSTSTKSPAQVVRTQRILRPPHPLARARQRPAVFGFVEESTRTGPGQANRLPPAHSRACPRGGSAPLRRRFAPPIMSARSSVPAAGGVFTVTGLVSAPRPRVRAFSASSTPSARQRPPCPRSAWCPSVHGLRSGLPEVLGGGHRRGLVRWVSARPGAGGTERVRAAAVGVHRVGTWLSAARCTAAAGVTRTGSVPGCLASGHRWDRDRKSRAPHLGRGAGPGCHNARGPRLPADPEDQTAAGSSSTRRLRVRLASSGMPGPIVVASVAFLM